MSIEEIKGGENELGFDPDALRKKYEFERDKRIRNDGNAQYVGIEGDFAHYIDDPYLESEIKRDPLADEVEVVIIGGGFGGLLAGARLRQDGVKDIRIIEKAGDFGGTWYWNRYPGVACDMESYVYLPLLEEMGYIPPKKFIDGADILTYSQDIARKFDLYKDVLFQTQVDELRWHDDISRWIISTNRGDAIKAKYLVMSNGPLNRPKLPGIPGIETFKGHTFHTSRWDYAYTGGDSRGGLNKIGGKRIGIIGTGGTAVQCVSHLGEGAGELFVFQRTPSSIDVRGDRDTDVEWFKAQEPGWHQNRMDNFNILVSGGVVEEDLVKDGWTEIIRNLINLVKSDDEPDLSSDALGKKMELADFQKMEQVRARAEEIVNDPTTAEALKPFYRQFCKRPCFDDRYLQTYNRENVTLVDTDGKGVEAITPKGIVAGGKEYELDCIIFGSGFEVGTGFARASGFETVGRGGVSLTEKWSGGMRTLHGMHANGFPNCFIMGSNGQTGFTANYPHSLNEQSKHIAYILKHVMENGKDLLEASVDAEDVWVEEIVAAANSNQDFLISCTPGYYNNEGQPEVRVLQNSNYGKGSEAFFKILKDWRADGDLKGLDFS